MGPTLASEVQKAAEYMSEQGKKDIPVTIQHVYRSISVSHVFQFDASLYLQRDVNGTFQADMVCELMFGKSLNLVDVPDAYHDLLRCVDRFSAITWPSMVSWDVTGAFTERLT
jgi:hypothetical protein